MKIIECECPCGTAFFETQSRVDFGRGKYCSRACLYKYRTRPSGLKYKIVNVNKSWYPKGFIPPTAWKVGDTAGEKNSNWKGGISLANKTERDIAKCKAKYKHWRMEVFKRDNFTCVLCGKSKSGQLEADHIKPWSKFPELRYEVSNGRTLCRDCHKTTNTYGGRCR